MREDSDEGKEGERNNRVGDEGKERMVRVIEGVKEGKGMTIEKEGGGGGCEGRKRRKRRRGRRRWGKRRRKEGSRILFRQSARKEIGEKNQGCDT